MKIYVNEFQWEVLRKYYVGLMGENLAHKIMADTLIKYEPLKKRKVKAIDRHNNRRP